MDDNNWSDINESIINDSKRNKFVNGLRNNSTTVQKIQDSKKRNVNKRTLQNKPRTLKNLRLFATTLLVGSLLTSGAHFLIKQAENKKNATSVQHEFEMTVIDDFKSKERDELLENLTFDNNDKLQIDIPCRIPEFYKVLKNTDIDELLCEYYKNPTKEAKALLFNQLQGREKEFATMNFNLLKASFADTYNNSSDDCKIIYNFTDNNYNSNNNDELITYENDMGTVLNIQTTEGNLEGYYREEKTNFTEVPSDFFKLMSTTAKTYVDINYFTLREDLMNSLMKNYLEIKNSYLEGYTLAIHPNEHKLCYAKKDKTNEFKYYDYDKKEIEEIQKNEIIQDNER